MTVLANRTGYAVTVGHGRDSGGGPALFVSVKAAFTWNRSGHVTTIEPEPVLVRDEVAGDGMRACLLRAAELGPRKPRVDVLLAGAIVLPAAVDEIDVTLEVGRE